MDLIAIIGAVVFFGGVLASVALHEIGHFAPAKWFDVRVTQYMVGFGRTVWSRRRGETEYGLKLDPVRRLRPDDRDVPARPRRADAQGQHRAVPDADRGGAQLLGRGDAAR